MALCSRFRFDDVLTDSQFFFQTASCCFQSLESRSEPRVGFGGVGALGPEWGVFVENDCEFRVVAGDEIVKVGWGVGDESGLADVGDEEVDVDGVDTSVGAGGGRFLWRWGSVQTGEYKKVVRWRCR